MGRLLKADVLALLILALLVIAYYSPYTSYTPTTTRTPTSISTLINVVLNKINEERQKSGVPPVKLFNDTTARFRAEDMYNNKYFGHCDLNGTMPNYHHTRLDGSYVIEENLGYYYIVGRDLIPTNVVVKNVENVIYDDAESNW